ncbi:MAG: aminotransferase class IV [Sphingobacteriales bacterium]|nr:aminotransferase class IV [Sphingobacteriales bacterium]
MGEFGLIETIKVVNGRIVFRNLHVKRLHRSLKVINIDESEYKLEDRILRLLKYECVEKGLKNFRLRLEVQKNRAHDYMPEIAQLKWNCVLRPLESTVYQLNEFGLSLTFLPKHNKSPDAFCNLKHTDRNIYEKSIKYARENDFDDALVLNENNTVADASIYNVFIVKDDVIYTPPLTDGPVAGVLRELLLTRLPTIQISEKSLTIQDVYAADEVFLTNVIRGIRWVKYMDEKQYSNNVTKQLFQEFKSVVSEHYGEHLV